MCATPEPRVLRELNDYLLQKCRVFEGSKLFLKKRRTRRVLPVSMKNDGLGAGRRSRKPRSVRRVERFSKPMVSETSCFTRFL